MNPQPDHSLDPVAEIVGDSLVVSLPAADPPCLWRSRLDELDSIRLELRGDADAAIWQLGTAEGEAFHPIARFSARPLAVAALTAIGQAQLRGGAAPPRQPRAGMSLPRFRIALPRLATVMRAAGLVAVLAIGFSVWLVIAAVLSLETGPRRSVDPGAEDGGFAETAPEAQRTPVSIDSFFARN